MLCEGWQPKKLQVRWIAEQTKTQGLFVITTNWVLVCGGNYYAKSKSNSKLFSNSIDGLHAVSISEPYNKNPKISTG